MIARLCGMVVDKGADLCVVDVGGVGYLAFCSARTLDNLRVGAPCTLIIETHVREDHIHLYGFTDTVERDWFRLLLGVQGIGAKVALGIQGVLDGEALLQAISSNDRAQISRANGVGQKLAGRVISELRDKVAAISIDSVPTTGHPISDQASGNLALREAASALQNLGYGPAEALGACTRAVHECADTEASSAPDDGLATTEQIIKRALALLAPSA